MTRSSRLVLHGLEEIGYGYADTLAEWRRRFHARLDGRAGARLRRALRAHLGLLPRVQRGGVPHALAARRPARADAAAERRCCPRTRGARPTY